MSRLHLGALTACRIIGAIAAVLVGMSLDSTAGARGWYSCAILLVAWAADDVIEWVRGRP